MIAALQSRLAAPRRAAGPKYQVLRDAILDAIAAGEWEAEARLPTESELSEALPYSLGTVQKAYGELVKGRMVVRSRGRGSFVAPGHRQLAEPWHCRFLDGDGTILPVYPTVLGHGPVAADWRGRGLFGQDADLLRIDRSLSIGGEFDVLSRFYAAAGVAAALMDRPHEQFEVANFKATLLRELGIPITRIAQTVSTPDERARRSLALPAGAFMLLEATAYTGRSEVAYFQELLIPSNRRKLLFDTDFHL